MSTTTLSSSSDTSTAKKQSDARPCGLAAVAADVMLGQCAEFVESLSDRVYAAESRVIRGGTIGKHVRHVLDHFAATIVGLDSPHLIEYDKRQRNVPMETARSEALAAIAELRRRLHDVEEGALAGQVRVRVMLASDGTEADLGSTLARELAFATHHAVHHHAMMKAIAAEFGVVCSSEFGIAPATIRHEQGE